MTKKEKILKAATHLFARNGFKQTAVSEIAREAGVAQGTVFHHFHSKDNLLVAICDELVTAYLSEMSEAAEGPGTGWEALERVLRFSVQFKKRHFDAIVVATSETRFLDTRDDTIRERFQRLMGQVIEIKSRCIERGMEDGSIREVPSHLTAFLIHILLDGIVHVETQGIFDVPDLAEEIVQFCCRSLCNDEEKCGPQGTNGG